jgi:hypothetical protein
MLINWWTSSNVKGCDSDRSGFFGGVLGGVRDDWRPFWIISAIIRYEEYSAKLEAGIIELNSGQTRVFEALRKQNCLRSPDLSESLLEFVICDSFASSEESDWENAIAHEDVDAESAVDNSEEDLLFS